MRKSLQNFPKKSGMHPTPTHRMGMIDAGRSHRDRLVDLRLDAPAGRITAVREEQWTQVMVCSDSGRPLIFLSCRSFRGSRTRRVFRDSRGRGWQEFGEAFDTEVEKVTGIEKPQTRTTLIKARFAK